MSKVVDVAAWAPKWAVGALRELVGSADQRPDGADGPGRWLVVTI